MLPEFKLNSLFNNSNKNIDYWYRQFLMDVKNIIQNKQFDIEENLYSFFKSRMEQALDEEKEQLLFIVLFLENHFEKCIEILKSSVINSFNSHILFTIINLEFHKKHPNETIEFLNIIINKHTHDCLKNDCELKKILTTLKDLVPQNRKLKQLLDKVVSIGSEYAWAYELME